MKEPIYSEGGKLLAIRDLESGALEIVKKDILSVIHFLDDGSYEVKDVPKNRVF